MTRPPTISQREQLIADAFKRCAHYRRGEIVDLSIHSAACELAKLQPAEAAFPNALKMAGQSKISEELIRFSHLIKQIDDIFRSFHEPSIQLLADAYISRSDIDKSISYLKYVAEVAEALDVSGVPRTVPRGKHKIFASAVASLVKYYFELVFGRPATITNVPIDSSIKGEYRDLLQRIYDVLGVETRDKSKPGWVSVSSMADAAYDATLGK